jgi:UDP-N-acetylglucosamine--N-acetylmuramyl-(pentapeptide) pyrophosphoryl-undecaprenol N-acetylglucosamine transferase
MAKQNAAIHMPQTEMSAQSVATLLETLTRNACLTMAAAAHKVGKRDSNESIAQVLEHATTDKKAKG